MAPPGGGDSVHAAMPARRPAGMAVLPLLLVVLTLSAFAPLWGNGFIEYDDEVYITANPPVREGLTARGLAWAFTTDHTGNWHPLTWLAHMLDVELFGLDPRGHHLAGLALHLANTVLLFLLLAGMTGSRWRGAAVAGLFAVHPLHVESVAWAAEKKDLLSTLLWLLALRAWLGFLARRRPGRYLLSLLLFGLALLAKPMPVTFPFTLLLLDWWPLGRFRQLSPARAVAEKAPFFLLSAASATVTYLVQSGYGAVRPADFYPFGARLGNAILSYVVYLRKAVWPADLAIFYPHSRQAPAPAAVAGALLVLLLVSLAAFLGRRRRPWLAVGWSWYLGTMVPVIGLVQVGAQALADRYTYVPLVGIFAALAWAVPRPAGAGRTAVAAAVAVPLLLLAAATGFQTARWRDQVTIFEHAVRVTEGNWTAHLNLAMGYERRGMVLESQRHLQAALGMRPGFGGTHARLGVKRPPGVPAARAPGVRGSPPPEVAGYLREGRTLLAAGNYREAAAWFAAALRLVPDLAEARAGLAEALARGGGQGVVPGGREE